MRKFLAAAIILIFICPSLCFAKVIKLYYPGAGLKSVIGYDKDNKRNGPYKLYYLDGKLKETGKFKHGKIVPGSIKHYSVDGVLMGQ